MIGESLWTWIGIGVLVWIVVAVAIAPSLGRWLREISKRYPRP